MEQMTDLLKAIREMPQEKKDDIRSNKEEMKTNQAKMDAKQEESTARLEIKMDSHHEKLMTSKEKLEACLGKTEAYPENMEADPKEMKSIAVHEEVRKEEATVETFGALKKRHRDWHLAVGRHGKPKEWTQGDGESQKVAAACRGMTHHAISISKTNRLPPYLNISLMMSSSPNVS
jgi:hypothetical protein